MLKPAGYKSLSKPATGTEAAGFSINYPSNWTVSQKGLYQTWLFSPQAGVNMLVDLTPHTYPGDMVQEAQYIECLGRQAEAVESDRERAALYRRMASLWEEIPGSTARAEECLEKLLAVDARSEDALRSLERLAAAYPDATCSLDHQTPLELLVSTILSAQCTAERVNLVTPVPNRLAQPLIESLRHEMVCSEARPPWAAHDEQSLASLRTAATQCTACDLYARATQTVFGEGSPQARMMLIGEQPGDQEDRAGRPFVGPAGRLGPPACGPAPSPGCCPACPCASRYITSPSLWAAFDSVSCARFMRSRSSVLSASFASASASSIVLRSAPCSLIVHRNAPLYLLIRTRSVNQSL